MGPSDQSRRLLTPFAALRMDQWDDYRFKTMYDVTVYLSAGESVNLGAVKIIERGQPSGRPSVPGRFRVLGEEFCSLGQSIEYYELVNALPEAIRVDYLFSMRDAVANPEIERAFSGERGWKESLLRFGQAENALGEGRKLLAGLRVRAGSLSFTFGTLGKNSAALRIPFDFEPSELLPSRCHVLIGYNGAGKTRLLAQLAEAASGVGRSSAVDRAVRLSGRDTTFGAVVAVSYSAFDTFETPERSRGERAGSGKTEANGYVYLGLRRVGQRAGSPEGDGQLLKSIDDIEAEFDLALRDARGRKSKQQGFLRPALESLAREPSFGRIGVDLLSFVRRDVDVRGEFSRLSTGHKIVLNIITQLAAHLQTRSLVLFDEPETHLHPPLMAALLRAVHILLESHDSFAIVATHSPVVVQEIPARYVRVLRRLGDEVSIDEAPLETFGENIGLITREVFALDSSSTDYQGILRSLASEYEMDDIEALFDLGLSGQARSLVYAFQRINQTGPGRQ